MKREQIDQAVHLGMKDENWKLLALSHKLRLVRSLKTSGEKPATLAIPSIGEEKFFGHHSLSVNEPWESSTSLDMREYIFVLLSSLYRVSSIKSFLCTDVSLSKSHFSDGLVE